MTGAVFYIILISEGSHKQLLAAVNKDGFGRGKFLMRGWRTKFIFLLVVYFAGFATAIYALSPVPESRISQPCEGSFCDSAFKSDEFAQTFNAKMHEYLGVAKDAARRASELVKQKLDDRQLMY